MDLYTLGQLDALKTAGLRDFYEKRLLGPLVNKLTPAWMQRANDALKRPGYGGELIDRAGDYMSASWQRAKEKNELRRALQQQGLVPPDR